jgi:hypothetical protein
VCVCVCVSVCVVCSILNFDTVLSCMFMLVFWSIMLPPSLEYKSTGLDVVGLHGKGKGN